ncbi:MAG TPA: hypothetical protein VFJ30_05310 [Phycisphaerae bacterium]|nr:hypothetical protein [Phycisphaerae bacterium]
MQDHERLTAAEQELERALASLAPAAPPLDRDRLMFQAGRAAGRRGRWFWPSTSAVAVVAVVLAVSLTVRPQPRQIERVVFVPVESGGAVSVAGPEPEAAEDRWADHARYAAIRNAMLAKGPDALPTSPPAAAATQRPPTLEDLLGTRRPKPPTPDPLGRLATMLFGDRS